MGQVDKPDVDNIEVSPAISIDQKSTSHNPRSTVGTVTEIQDYQDYCLVVLASRIVITVDSIAPQTIDEMVDQILLLPERQGTIVGSCCKREERNAFKIN